MARITGRTWIFVSHSSEDLLAVRKVRNYLEEKDASPLLFHLLALKDEEEFWPIIENEIQERDFFLLCDSEGARQSTWVQREREAFERFAAKKLKRKFEIRVDAPDLDLASLDAFISATKVFPSFSREDEKQVQPILAALERRGFEIFNDIQDVDPHADFGADLQTAIADVAARGFVVIFLSRSSLNSDWVKLEIEKAAKLRARLIPIMIEPGLPMSSLPVSVTSYRVFDATQGPFADPEALADLLHKEAI